MLYITYTLNYTLMIALPLVLGYGLTRMFHVKPYIFGVGALTFIASQVVHIPILYGLTALFAAKIIPGPPVEWNNVFNAVVLGLLAGLCEELARYLVYKHWLTEVRDWATGLVFGAGHGGIEAIIFGLFGALSYIQMLSLKTLDLTQLPAEQRALVIQQLNEFWNAPWYVTLFGAVERSMAIIMHLTLALLVLQAFQRGPAWRWVGLAVLWHALANAVTYYVMLISGAEASELTLAGFTLANLVLIFSLRKRSAPAMNQMATH
jgi:uncharacterized membrane protein YhfC